MGTYLSKDASVLKNLHEDAISFVSRDMSAELWKNALPRSVAESFKMVLDLAREADHFQNLTSSSMSTDTSLVKFLRRSDQWFLHEVANRQTDRQTDAEQNITSLAEVMVLVLDYG